MEKGVLTRSGEKGTREKYLLLFVVSFVGMMLSFVPVMIKNGGIFLYYGDFNSQQNMFYFHANEMIRNGNMGWDWGTDLGSNFIGSYSFYLLGSPFFWLSTLFPLSMVKYLLPWLLSLKTAVAAVSAYAYIRRFVKNPDSCFIGAMLYAFSGFQVYNVFFNHFHDVTAFFPLLLLAFEQMTQDGRRGVFALCVALCAAISYFFFVCEVVFVVLYFFIRCTDKDFRMDFRIFARIIIEAVIGVAISCIILLPAVYDVLTNPRLASRLYGTDMVFYNESVRVPRIIQAFFMMSDMPARVNILQSENGRWASIAGYLPLFAMCGVIAFIRNHKKSWVTKLVIVSFIMMCVPWLNSLFVALNSSYYARWFYMPILIMCLMTAKMTEEDPDKLKSGYIISTAVGAGFVAIGVLPKQVDGKTQFLQNFQYKEMYYMQALVTLILAAILGVIIYYLPRSEKFGRIVSAVTAAACIITMGAGVNFGAVQDGGHDEYIKYAINGRSNINTKKLDSANEYNHLSADNTFFRIDTSENVDNWCMFWGLSSMRTFHSVVPPSIMEFYESIGQTRDVASRMEPKLYALRSMFSVRYYFNRKDGNTKPAETINDLYGFEYIDTQNDFNIYENKNWIPMGYAYDAYTTDSVVQSVTDTRRPNVLLKAVVLDNSQIIKYNDILEHYQYEQEDTFEDAYEQECENKRAQSCYYFKESTDGFDAKIKLESDKLVFFSVPYAEGWTATVNGKPANIEKVNYGFMAVRCPAGDNTIRFDYKTAGLKEGKLLTAGGAAVLVIYVAVGFVFDRKRRPVTVKKAETTVSGGGDDPKPGTADNTRTEQSEQSEQQEQGSE